MKSTTVDNKHLIALLFLAAVVPMGCDRFNDSRIFVTFSDPAVRPQIEEVLTSVLAKRAPTCWEANENSQAFSEFDRKTWSCFACLDTKLGLWVDFGSSDGAAFANLRLTSSGFRSEPETFADLRSEIISAFIGVAGTDNVEVINGTVQEYTEDLHEAAEKRRVEQTPTC